MLHPQVHVRLDTSLQEDKLKIQAFVSRSLTLGDKSLAMEFVELPCDVLYGDVERVGGMLLGLWLGEYRQQQHDTASTLQQTVGLGRHGCSQLKLSWGCSCSRWQLRYLVP